MTDSGDEHDERRAREAERRRREFIRTYHPDRGGDPESFIAGLRRFEDEQASAGPGPGSGPDAPTRVTVIPHRPWPTRLVTAAVRRLRPSPPRVR